MSRFDKYPDEPSARLETMGVKFMTVESPVDVTANYNDRNDSVGRSIFVTTFFFSKDGVFGALVPIYLYESGEIMATVGLTGALRESFKLVIEIVVLEDGKWLNVLKEKNENGKFPTTNFFDDLEKAMGEFFK